MIACSSSNCIGASPEGDRGHPSRDARPLAGTRLAISPLQALHRVGRVLPSHCSARRLLIVGELRRDLGDVLALIAGAVEFVSARLPRTIGFGQRAGS